MSSAELCGPVLPQAINDHNLNGNAYKPETNSATNHTSYADKAKA